MTSWTPKPPEGRGTLHRNRSGVCSAGAGGFEAAEVSCDWRTLTGELRPPPSLPPTGTRTRAASWLLTSPYQAALPRSPGRNHVDYPSEHGDRFGCGQPGQATLPESAPPSDGPDREPIVRNRWQESPCETPPFPPNPPRGSGVPAAGHRKPPQPAGISPGRRHGWRHAFTLRGRPGRPT